MRHSFATLIVLCLYLLIPATATAQPYAFDDLGSGVYTPLPAAQCAPFGTEIVTFRLDLDASTCCDEIQVEALMSGAEGQKYRIMIDPPSGPVELLRWRHSTASPWLRNVIDVSPFTLSNSCNDIYIERLNSLGNWTKPQFCNPVTSEVQAMRVCCTLFGCPSPIQANGDEYAYLDTLGPEALNKALGRIALRHEVDLNTTIRTQPIECHPGWNFVSGDVGPGHLTITLEEKCCPYPVLKIANENAFGVRCQVTDAGMTPHYDGIIPPGVAKILVMELGCPPLSVSAVHLTIKQSVGGGDFIQTWQLICYDEECLWD